MYDTKAPTGVLFFAVRDNPRCEKRVSPNSRRQWTNEIDGRNGYNFTDLIKSNPNIMSRDGVEALRTLPNQRP